MAVSTALMCVALNVYHESRGESFTGQIAVAQVTMRRAKLQELDPCIIIKQPRQFSWYKGGALKKYVPGDSAAWANALIIGDLVINEVVPDFSKGATSFHAINVSPFWRSSMLMVVQIGRHVFYKPKPRTK